MRFPSSQSSPEVILAPAGSSPIRACPVMDFPAPDSPTMPRISPSAMEKSTPSKARSVLPRVEISTVRFFTSRMGVFREV